MNNHNSTLLILANEVLVNHPLCDSELCIDSKVPKKIDINLPFNPFGVSNKVVLLQGIIFKIVQPHIAFFFS